MSGTICHRKLRGLSRAPSWTSTFTLSPIRPLAPGREGGASAVPDAPPARLLALLIRMEDVVLRLHGDVARVAAAGLRSVRRHRAGRVVVIEHGVAPTASI